MKKLELCQMENVEGGEINWFNAVGCAAGVGMIYASFGVNIFAFAIGVNAIVEYCGGVFTQ